MVIRKIEWTKWISIGITLLALTAGAVVWAATSHSDLKDSSIQGDHAVKVELKADSKEKYTPLHKFTKVEQKIDDQTKTMDGNSNKIDKLDTKIDKLDNKLDTIINRLHSTIRGSGHNNQ